MVAFFLALSGSWTTVHYPQFAVGTGFMLLVLTGALFLHLFRARKITEHVFPICLIGFGYGVAGMVAIGRSGMEEGLALALASKYASFTLTIYVGLILIAYKHLLADAPQGRGPMRNAVLTGLALLTACMLLVDVAYLYGCFQWRQARVANVEIIRNYRQADWTELHTVGPFPDEDSARHLISLLEAWKWNVFAP